MTLVLTHMIFALELFAAQRIALEKAIRRCLVLNGTTLNKPGVTMRAAHLLDVDIARPTLATVTDLLAPMAPTSEHLFARPVAQGHSA